MTLLNDTKEPVPALVGETRIVDGQLAMCLSPRASYGGGSGELWAVENAVAQFTLKSHSGRYIEGICRKVHPRHKAVTMEITRGQTWGRLASGKRVNLLASEFSRYHAASDAGERLIFESMQKRSAIMAEQAFVDISIAELEASLRSEYQDQLNELIGSEHEHLRHLIAEYIGLCKAVNAAKGHCVKLPSTKISRHIRNIKKTFAAIQERT